MLTVLLGICVFALLLPVHHQPLPHFMTELVFAVGAMLSVLWALRGIERLKIRVDGVVVLMALAVPVTLAQIAQGKATPPDVLMFWGYMFFALVFYQLGHVLGSSEERATNIEPIAWAILVAAMLSGVAGGFQLAHRSLPLGLIYRADSVLYGNLAQSNHFNDLMWLGIVSAVFLVARKRLQDWCAAGCIAVLIASSVLSGSRSGIVYSCLITLLPLVLMVHRGKRAWRQYSWPLLMMPAYLVTLILVTRLDLAHHWGLIGLSERFSTPGSTRYALSGEIRFHLWRNLLPAMEFAGRGIGSFQDAMRFEPHLWLKTGFPVVPEHAHNELIETGFELGWGLMLAALVLFVRWAWRRRVHAFDVSDFWALGILAIIGTHAMLEYPLRYIYFLGTFCLALGFLSPIAAPVKVLAVSRHAALVPVLAALMIPVIAFRQFFPSDEILYQLQSGHGFMGREKTSVFAELDEVPAISPFKRYASLVKGLVASPEDIRRGGLADDCDNVVRVWLSARSLGNCASSYMLNGSPEKAVRLMEMVCVSDPEKAPEVLERFATVVGQMYLLRPDSACVGAKS